MVDCASMVIELEFGIAKSADERLPEELSIRNQYVVTLPSIRTVVCSERLSNLQLWRATLIIHNQIGCLATECYKKLGQMPIVLIPLHLHRAFGQRIPSSE